MILRRARLVDDGHHFLLGWNLGRKTTDLHASVHCASLLGILGPGVLHICDPIAGWFDVPMVVADCPKSVASPPLVPPKPINTFGCSPRCSRVRSLQLARRALNTS